MGNQSLARGPWRVVLGIVNRSVNVQHRISRFSHHVYYGRRTGRTQEAAETQPTDVRRSERPEGDVRQVKAGSR